MSHNEDSLAGDFEELLSMLENVLEVDQIWELQNLIRYDEHEFAFVMLIAALRRAAATVPQQASAPFLRLAEQLRVDAVLWR